MEGFLSELLTLAVWIAFGYVILRAVRSAARSGAKSAIEEHAHRPVTTHHAEPDRLHNQQKGREG